jgi:hypothetical protein
MECNETRGSLIFLSVRCECRRKGAGVEKSLAKI